MLLFINFELIWGAWGRELYKRNLFVTRGGPKRSTARERQAPQRGLQSVRTLL